MTNSADGRVREDDRGDVLVVHLQVRSVVENAFNEHSSRFDGNGGQSHLVGHITDRVHSWHGRILERVHLDG